MNLLQIRAEAWDLARETATIDADRLWTAAEMNRYINRVYRRITSETKCIRDAITSEVCNITSAPVDYTTYALGTPDYVWANDPSSWLYHQNVCPYRYALHPAILAVDEVKWTSRQWKLVKVSVGKWQTNPWWEQVKGMPTEYAVDYSNNTLVVNFRDTTTDTLRLIVRRLPLTDLKDDIDTPEFRQSYHEFFLNGVLALMYSKQDSETVDEAKAKDFEARFLRDLDEIKQQESLLEERLRPNYSMSAFR